MSAYQAPCYIKMHTRCMCSGGRCQFPSTVPAVNVAYRGGGNILGAGSGADEMIADKMIR